MQVGDMYLGEIDTKNEVLRQVRKNTDVFFQYYMLPNNIKISDLFDGSKFFVTGFKGTGKTALLRYLNHRLLEEGCLTNFTLFKTNISEEERIEFSRSTGYSLVDPKSSKYGIEQDFKLLWKWYLFQKLYDCLSEEIVSNRSAYQRLGLLLGITAKEKKKTLFDFLPKFEKGTLKLKINFSVAEMEGKGEFRASDDRAKETIHFTQLCSLAEKEFLELGKIKQKIYLFLDELELFYERADQFDRDRRLLRDLLFAVTQFNTMAIENHMPVHVVAAVRSEVLRAIYGIAQELSRDVRDFEVQVSWDYPVDDKDHPLLKLIERRIEISEREKAFNRGNHTVWEYYFPQYIQDQPIRRYLLHSSFYRPRDLIRLLSNAQKFRPQSQKFTQEMFDRTVKEFSQHTWDEISDELLAAYTSPEIDKIRRLFFQQYPTFTKDELLGRILEKLGTARTESEKKQYGAIYEHGVEQIIEDLYRIGAVGNYIRETGYNHWIFRGDPDPDFNQPFIIHRSLWKHFERRY